MLNLNFQNGQAPALNARNMNAIVESINTLGYAVGGPNVASTVSAMTDTSKVYVYTGSETGYTAGNWYYYNGSAWVSGGVYQAAAVETDTTLTMPGEPADAKATGDAIADLKSALGEISSATKNLNTKGCGRYSANNSSGVISANTGGNVAGMSDKIPCKESTQYTVTYYGVTFTIASFYALYYDSNGDFLSFERNNNITGSSRTFTTPANTAYIYFYIYSGTGVTISDSSKIQVEEGSVSTSYVQPITAYDVVLREQLTKILDGLASHISINLYDGYYNASGTIATASSPNYEKYTQKIYATQYTEIKYQLNYSSSRDAWLACSVWKADGTFTRTVIVNETGSSFSGTVAISSDVVQTAFSFRSFGEENVLNLVGIANTQSFVNVASKSNTIDGNILRSSIGVNSLRFKPFYDHLFIDKINGENVIIPSESLFNIEISHRLGFDIIEANVHPTSDGKFIVMHGVSGKFGAQVQHVDGTTDISNTAINSVTLAWIKSNVRYKSLYAKYRVAPPSLEEFLYECRKNCMIPMVTASNTDALAIIDKIMGKANYIAYNGSREYTDAPILTYPSLTTKAEILALCESYGKPYMYCMANPDTFSDSDLSDIVNTLHESGFLIGYAGSYLSEVESQRLLSFGFDFCASKYQINEFESGNLCNLSADIDYSDFDTNGTVSDGLLTLTNGQYIQPSESLQSVFLGGGSLHIRFNGSLTFNMGGYINHTLISDGSQSVWLSTYYMNRVPTFTITATAQTQIINIDFKASKM